jgi:hypothetical protein
MAPYPELFFATAVVAEVALDHLVAGVVSLEVSSINPPLLGADLLPLTPDMCPSPSLSPPHPPGEAISDPVRVWVEPRAALDLLLLGEDMLLGEVVARLPLLGGCSGALAPLWVLVRLLLLNVPRSSVAVFFSDGVASLKRFGRCSDDYALSLSSSNASWCSSFSCFHHHLVGSPLTALVQPFDPPSTAAKTTLSPLWFRQRASSYITGDFYSKKFALIRCGRLLRLRHTIFNQRFAWSLRPRVRALQLPSMRSPSSLLQSLCLSGPWTSLYYNPLCGSSQ